MLRPMRAAICAGRPRAAAGTDPIVSFADISLFDLVICSGPPVAAPLFNRQRAELCRETLNHLKPDLVGA